MYQHGLIAPVIALVLWSLIVFVWMYATRFPAMAGAKIKPQDGAFTREMGAKLPAWARQVADNYNHLMEQPTIFYATALAAQLAGATDAYNVGLAWLYVALRAVHSLIQGTVNIVPLRFLIFTVGTVALAILAVRVALSLCTG